VTEPAYHPAIPPSVRISANYAATDGRCPEEIVVDLPIEQPGPDPRDVDMIVAIVRALAEVPIRAQGTRDVYRDAKPRWFTDPDVTITMTNEDRQGPAGGG